MFSLIFIFIKVYLNILNEFTFMTFYMDVLAKKNILHPITNVLQEDKKLKPTSLEFFDIFI